MSRLGSSVISNGDDRPVARERRRAPPKVDRRRVMMDKENGNGPASVDEGRKEARGEVMKVDMHKKRDGRKALHTVGRQSGSVAVYKCGRRKKEKTAKTASLANRIQLRRRGAYDTSYSWCMVHTMVCVWIPHVRMEAMYLMFPSDIN